MDRNKDEFHKRFLRWKKGENVYDRGTIIPYEDREYDYSRANELGYTPDNTGHMPSRDYETGRYLKRPSHPTILKSIVADLGEGYIPTYNKDDGLIYSHRFPDDLPRYAGGKDPNEDVADFLRQHEGYSDKVYLDGNGIPTIGYGFTDPKFVSKGTISRSTADTELKRQIKSRQSTLRNILGSDKWDSLTDDSRKALTSYHFNYPAGFKDNTKFMKAWRAGNYAEAIRQVDAGMNDSKNPGLRTRRLAEQALLKADPFLVGRHEVPIQPIIAQPVSTAVRPTIPEQYTVPAYDTLVNPYISGKHMLHLMPTVNIPDLILMIEDSLWQPAYADGKLPEYKNGKIYIKPANRGKFTALKKRTGHSASWFKENGTPAQKKMATFALNAKKWHHANGKLPGYEGGKIGHNVSHAEMNSDGTFTDDYTKLFEDMYVTPQKTDLKRGSYTLNNFPYYLQHRTDWMKPFMSSGTNEKGLKLINPEFDLLTGIKMLTPTVTALDRKTYHIAREMSKGLKKNPVLKSYNSNPSYLDTGGNVLQYLDYINSLFPNSKIKDIVYHSTWAKPFLQFDPSKIKRGYGFYFSPSENHLPFDRMVYSRVNIQNPLEIFPNKNRNLDVSGLWRKDLTELAIRNGLYDGIVGVSNMKHPEEPEIVALNPDQIHILGSNKDLAGFKQFVNYPNKITE